jgi:hypothetical protein
VGFLTVREVAMRECDAADRRHLGLAGPHADGETCWYILTLGVSPAHRRRGVAAALVQQLYQRACASRARQLFLHVIAYNRDAMRFYARHGFACLGLLPGFYHISTGRQPDPAQLQHDAFLYALHLPAREPLPGPWLGAWQVAWAAAPLRCAWDQLSSCLAHSGCWAALGTAGAPTHGAAGGPCQRGSGGGGGGAAPVCGSEAALGGAGGSFRPPGDSRRRAWAAVHAGGGQQGQQAQGQQAQGQPHQHHHQHQHQHHQYQQHHQHQQQHQQHQQGTMLQWLFMPVR